MRHPSPGAPPWSAFTPAERRLIDRLRTPARVQAYLNALRYNTEPDGDDAADLPRGRPPSHRALL